MSGTAQETSNVRGNESETYDDSDDGGTRGGRIDVSLGEESSDEEYEVASPSPSPNGSHTKASAKAKSDGRKKGPKRKAKKTVRKAPGKKPAKNNIFLDKMKHVCSKCAKTIRDDNGFLTKRSYFAPGGKYAEDAFDSYMSSVRGTPCRGKRKKKHEIDDLSDNEDDAISWDSLDEYLADPRRRNLHSKGSASGTPPPAGKGRTRHYEDPHHDTSSYGPSGYERGHPYDDAASNHYPYQHYHGANKGKKGKGKPGGGGKSKNAQLTPKGKSRKQPCEENYYWSEGFYSW